MDRTEKDVSLTRSMSRRSLLQSGLAALAAVSSASVARNASSAEAPATPAPSSDTTSPYVPRPAAAQYVFRVERTTLDPDGKQEVKGLTVNGSLPGSEIRVREGDWLRVRVENHLSDSPTTIHWHGLLVPAGMDGVPDVSNDPIGPKRVYIYEYPILQSGTYWYHSHVKFQEQVGLSGPFIIEPKDETLKVEHDAVVMLGDWLHESPEEVFATLKQGQKKPAAKDTGADLADVEYNAFLLNGRASQAPWTLAARPGEKIRLRIINSSASTFFRLMLDGHPLEITHADGLAVRPITVDSLLMGTAECYDAVVTLSESGSYTLHAVSQDGSGQAIGVLHTPDVKPQPNRQMPTFTGKALSYTDLRAVEPTTLPKGDVRTFTLNLQGDMKNYVWMINDQVYPKADPLVIKRGERVKLEMINHTMMWHPMHLHGHFFRVLQGAGELCPLKHTVNVPPRQTVRIEFTADNPGRWIFHCHNLYHLDAGMARVFEYET